MSIATTQHKTIYAQSLTPLSIAFTLGATDKQALSILELENILVTIN